VTDRDAEAGIRVLLVDDSTQSRRALRALLSASGVSVAGEAANGAEGLQLAERLQPDLVIMDIRMPVMDGLDATRLLKQRWPRMSVLMLSLEDNPTGAFAAGADAFILKGEPESKLIDTITKLAGATPDLGSES
jgi:DNA-binding NarL/FixJ family response regulator